MATMQNQGTRQTGALLVGDWSRVTARQSAVDYLLGNCPEGVLEVEREDYIHHGTEFPRRTDFIAPIRIGFKFSGKLEEIQLQNVHGVIGDVWSSTGNYVYVGALKPANYFTITIDRQKFQDSTIMTAKLHKVLAAGSFQIGSGDEAQGMEVEFVALDDEDAFYGGSINDPLGWIYVPTIV